MAKGIATAGEEQKAALQNVCSRALAGFKALSVMLTPVLPVLTQKVAQDLFGAAQAYQWADAGQLPTRIAPFKPMMQRIEPKIPDALFEPHFDPVATP